jgi:hypothetical protein
MNVIIIRNGEDRDVGGPQRGATACIAQSGVDGLVPFWVRIVDDGYAEGLGGCIAAKPVTVEKKAKKGRTNLSPSQETR